MQKLGPIKRSPQTIRTIPLNSFFEYLIIDSKTSTVIFAVKTFHSQISLLKGTWFTNPLGQREVDRLFPVMR